MKNKKIQYKKLNIVIGKIPLSVEIEKDLIHIQGLFKFFKNKKKSKKSRSKRSMKNNIKIVIKSSNKKSMKLSKSKKSLIITGSDIDNLSNPFNLIGILQATFRFIGLHSIKDSLFLLHGSAALFKNKAICFADDGSSTGKTISSVECALNSKGYIGDEFCFLDEKYNILSYTFIPIHIRTRVQKYLKRFHKNQADKIFSGILRTKAGYFIDPKRIFKVKNSKKLSALIFVHFIRNTKPYLKKLDEVQSKQAVLKCTSTHLIKFFHPELDRMQFIQEKDITKEIHYNKKIINQIKKDLALSGNIDYIAKKIPCYQFFIREPKEVISLLKKIKL